MNERLRRRSQRKKKCKNKKVEVKTFQKDQEEHQKKISPKDLEYE